MLNEMNISRTSPADQSRKWGIYYVVDPVMKCYFGTRFYHNYRTSIHVIRNQVKRISISLSKNILRALDANSDIPPLTACPRSHRVCRILVMPVHLMLLKVDYSAGHVSILSRNVKLLERRLRKGTIPSKPVLQRPLTFRPRQSRSSRLHSIVVISRRTEIKSS